jgi:hypothetical protein
MEEKALECLKGMLTSRQIKVEKADIIGNPLEETRMFNMGGVLIIFSEKGRLTEGVLNSYIVFASENGHTHGVIIVSLSQPSESILGLVR